MMARYNGWYNYETWRASMIVSDCQEEIAQDIGSEATREEIADYLAEWLEDAIMVDVTPDSVAADIVDDYLREVSYDELTEIVEEVIAYNKREEVNG